ncbi:cryptococcal mannosyltransferase 1-domain-containing protein [Peziza echinospora]|nr:cryptococcal mannosyltransferase 1-domain-containing protein [Peziza echinospora]
MAVWRRVYRLLVRPIKIHPFLSLLAICTAALRAAFPIFTHNSVTLSAWISGVFVVVPLWTLSRILLALERHFDDGIEEREEAGIWWDQDDICERHLHKGGYPEGTKGVVTTKIKKIPAHQKTTGSLFKRHNYLIFLGIIMTIYTYTSGIAFSYATRYDTIHSGHQHRNRQGNAEKANEKYFLAINFYNNAPVIPHFTNQLLHLVEHLGKDNVYISMVENDSQDDTKLLLWKFTQRLSRKGWMEGKHWSLGMYDGLRERPYEMPWIDIPDRMAYMAQVRNLALNPLDTLPTRFTKILFFNDILFHYTQALHLLSLRNGNYALACPLDMDAAGIYDTWVLRDKCGKSTSMFWPFFQDQDDRKYVERAWEGRLSAHEASRGLEVGVCWNGLAVMDALEFLRPEVRMEALKSSDETLTTELLPSLRFPPPPPDCIMSECTFLPLHLLSRLAAAKNSDEKKQPVVLLDPTFLPTYSHRWYFFYNVLFELPIVRNFLLYVEFPTWKAWWWIGMGDWTRWNGVFDVGEKTNMDASECVVENWPRCQGSGGTWEGLGKEVKSWGSGQEGWGRWGGEVFDGLGERG